MSNHLFLRGIMLLAALMLSIQASAEQKEFRVSLSVKDKSVEEILKVIEKQTPYKFMYHTNDIKSLGKKSIDLKDVALKTAMDACLKGTNISYQIVDDVIVLKRTSTTQPTNKKRTIKGVVNDENGAPLPGAFISLAGTTIGRISDGEGAFTITVPEEEQTALIITFVGYNKKLVMVSDNTPLKINLAPDAMAVEDVVVTGYATTSKKLNTGSSTTINAKDILQSGKTNIAEMLQGQVAGMIVTNTSGRVGASPNIQIRGQSTLGSDLGNQNPIWVVDGIIQDDPIELNNMTGVVDDLKNLIGNQVSWLNPNDIETITVLKDASATAIYGSRASNGVIVITTKSPKGEKVSVSYSGGLTFKSKPNYDQFNFMNSQERVQITEEMLSLGMKFRVMPLKDMNTFEGVMQLYLDNDISAETFLKRRAELETMNTNWFDVLTRNAVSHNHNISVMGRASDKINFTASMGYNKDNGQEISNSMERFTSRIAVTANIHSKLKVNLTLNGTINKTTGVPSGNNSSEILGGGIPLNYATNISRAIPAYEQDGTPAIYRVRTNYKYNDSGSLGFNMENEMNESSAINKGGRLSIALNAQWEIKKWLKYEFVGGYNYSDVTREIYRSERSFYVANGFRGYDYGSVRPNSAEYNASIMPHGGILDENKGNQYSYNIQNKLSFAHTFNQKHTINAMLANEVRSSLKKDFSTSVWGVIPERGYSLTAPPRNVIGITNPYSPNDYGILEDLYRGRTRIYENKNNFVSLFATFVYSYDHRYVFNASIRNDMSNRFGQDTNRRLDPTYSFGLKWNVTDEPLMKSRMKWLTSLNVSINYGIQGNAQLAMSPDLILTKGSVDGVYHEFISTIDAIPNPNLSWERTTNWNYALSTRLCNAVNVSVDYYTRKSNAVISRNIGYENGIATMQLNGGMIYNRGFEATVAFSPVNTEDFGFNISINSSKNWNEGGASTMKKERLEKYGTYTKPEINEIIKEGYPIGSFWAYSFDRLNGQTGSPMFHNMNVDPLWAKENIASMLTYCGTSTPNFTGGVNLTARYKQLTLTSTFSMLLGAKTFLPSPYLKDNGSYDYIPRSEQNLSKDLTKRWRKPGDENFTIYPSLRAKQEKIIMPGEATGGDNKYGIEMWALSDAMVVNKDFFRCTNLSLSYNIDNRFTQKLKLSSLNIAASVTDLFVIGSKRFNGFDPELGDSVRPRTFSISLNIGF